MEYYLKKSFRHGISNNFKSWYNYYIKQERNCLDKNVAINIKKILRFSKLSVFLHEVLIFERTTLQSEKLLNLKCIKVIQFYELMKMKLSFFSFKNKYQIKKHEFCKYTFFGDIE
ncbi:hypothetical protein AB204_04050 [Xenorhabdus khoisanae]|uniref:Uncharacterized protein n=1 Tax=Xenorhabdus khoisanae TaxID=880157 RepID=A0A0J5FWM5_9GAMM|nr:hypothetical protein AB204_04050 [Xenorhabdus khoisanae]